MGWLFKKVHSFLQNEGERGLIFQSLCYGIREELNEYYRLIAILENLRESEDEQSKSSFFIDQDSSSKSLSLRKLYLWSIEPFERLKWIGILCDACKSSKGCTLLSIVTTYAKQGSPSIQVLFNRILIEVLGPFSTFLREWVYKGELIGHYEEFFVTVNLSSKDDNFW
jgi:gamma-tubulin complex component 3